MKFSQFWARLTAKSLRKPPPLTPFSQWGAAPESLPMLTDAAAQAAQYGRSVWVYVAVSRIAEAAAMVTPHVYRLNGELREPVSRHPLEDLLNAPNPTMSRFDLFEQTIGMLELTGNAYWFLAGDGAGTTPREIWMLRPDRVAIVPSASHGVSGYIYEVGGVRIPLEPSEVIHFKRWNPLNDYYGMSALEAAAISVHTDRAMAEWNRSTFSENHAVPSGVVLMPSGTSTNDLERVRREWTLTYGGNTGRKVAFLAADDARWQSIGQTHADLDFLRGRHNNRDEILNIFGVPVGLVSENATEANARVAERTFLERTLRPKLIRLAAKISAELLPFYEPNAVLEFEDVRPVDAQARAQDIQSALHVMSINEVRARYYSLPPVTWGEQPATQPTNATP